MLTVKRYFVAIVSHTRSRVYLGLLLGLVLFFPSVVDHARCLGNLARCAGRRWPITSARGVKVLGQPLSRQHAPHGHNVSKSRNYTAASHYSAPAPLPATTVDTIQTTGALQLDFQNPSGAAVNRSIVAVVATALKRQGAVNGLRFRLKAMVEVLPADVKIYVLCHPYKTLALCQNSFVIPAELRKNGRVQLRPAPTALSAEDTRSKGWYNEMLGRRTFWDMLAPYSHVLLFEMDSILCKSPSISLQEFLQYDMVGAPWAGSVQGIAACAEFTKRAPPSRSDWQLVPGLATTTATNFCACFETADSTPHIPPLPELVFGESAENSFFLPEIVSPGVSETVGYPSGIEM